MTVDPTVLADLRAAINAPTLVDANYTHESIHRNVLLTALNSSDEPAVHRLAAALWNLAVTRPDERLNPDQISHTIATREHGLSQGPNSVVDLHLAFTANDKAYRLAVELKVDSAPTNRQLLTMRDALGPQPEHRLVLLALGTAQASRIEPDGSPHVDVPRWSISDMLTLGDLITAASPSPNDVQTWLCALRREQRRRELAWDNHPELAGCFRGERHRLAYRYVEAAGELLPASTWRVSLQPHGVVLHGVTSHRKVPGVTPGAIVTLYLEVAGGTLRLKAGDWDTETDARAATEPYLPAVEAGLRARGIPVKRSSNKSGVSVTLLSMGAAADTREAFVAQLRHVHDVWRNLPLAK